VKNSGRIFGISPGEVHVASIHQIEGPGFEDKIVQPTNVVLARSSDMNAGWNRTAQVDLGVQLDAALFC